LRRICTEAPARILNTAPVLLPFVAQIVHLPDLTLLPRSFGGACRNRGELVYGRQREIAERETYAVAIGGHHALGDWMEGAAGRTLIIAKLFDLHRRVYASLVVCWLRVYGRSMLGRRGCCERGLRRDGRGRWHAHEQIAAADCNQQHDGDDDDRQ